MKYIFTPSNINSIKCIYADKNGGYFNHADLLMPDKFQQYKRNLKLRLGGYVIPLAVSRRTKVG